MVRRTVGQRVRQDPVARPVHQVPAQVPALLLLPVVLRRVDVGDVQLVLRVAPVEAPRRLLVHLLVEADAHSRLLRVEPCRAVPRRVALRLPVQSLEVVMPCPVVQVNQAAGHVGEVVPHDPSQERPVLDRRHQAKGLFREAVADHAPVVLPAALAEPLRHVRVEQRVEVHEPRVEVVHVAPRVDVGVQARHRYLGSVDHQGPAHGRVI